MINLDDALAGEFLAEAREHLASMERDLLAFEKNGAEIDEERVNRVFRAIHSIKGGSGFFDAASSRTMEASHAMRIATPIVINRAASSDVPVLKWLVVPRAA